MSSAVMGSAGLSPADLVGLPDDHFIDAWRDLEQLRNQLAMLDQHFLVEAEQRGLPAKFGARDVAALARGVLRVHPREAAARVRAADAAVGRASITGVPCPAPYALVGAAQECGTSPRATPR